MGVVYQARDTVLGRTVALKALPTDRADDPERRRRFLTEARSASALHHANIVTVHDLLAHEGSDWIVMEHVDGRTLDQVMPPEGLPLPQALRWAADVTDALQTAHEAGIIHRDLKPGNLMIDTAGRVRVLDFGLAKLDLSAEPGADGSTLTSPLTVAGAVMGTLEYMSPEQAMGRPVDPRSDVFSLGAVLYQMLTGRRPFTGDNAASKVHSVAFERPPPPAELRPETPEEVSDLVLRALEKDPEDRFQTMAEMGEALRGVERRASGAGEGRAAGQLRRTWKGLAAKLRGALAERRPRSWVTTAAAALVLAVLLTAALAIIAPAWVPALPGTPYAHLEEASALLDTYWRDDHVDRAVELLQRAIDQRPDYSPAHAALAGAYLRVYDTERDSVWLERARAQADRALELDPSSSRARLNHARVLLAEGKTEAAKAELEEILVRDPINADAHRLLGEAHQASGETEAALELLGEASTLDPENPLTHSTLGTALYDAGRYEEGAEAFRRAAEVAPDYLFAYRNRAAALGMLGRYGEAAEQLQRALEIRRDAPTYANLGTLYFLQGLYPQALQAYEQAVDFGANDHQIWTNLGDAYRWSPGREEDARRAYTRALQLLARESEQTPRDPEQRSRRALLQAKRGTGADREESVTVADELAKDSSDPGVLYRLVLTYELLDRRDRALELLPMALTSGYSATWVEEDPELTELRNDPRYHLIMVDHAGTD